MTDIATIEPSAIVKGDSVTWKRSFSDYPATAGWVLSYALRADGKAIDIEAEESSGDHLITLDAAGTNKYAPGTYAWQAYVTKDSERHTVDSGTMEIKRNFADVDSFDSRSHVKKVLDAIEAVIEGRASTDQEEYQIGTRMLKRTPIPELLTLRDKYQGYYNTELNAERIKKGLKPRNRILVRM